MPLRAPDRSLHSHPLHVAETGGIETEIASEKAASLGRTGKAVAAALARLRDPGAVETEGQEQLLNAAAQAVWMFFVQREACGLRDQAAVIRDLEIPRAVIVRIGAL